MRNLKDYILLFLKGMAMGGADVVPGVSGGTIAFISGIYEELINSLKSIDLANIKLLFSGKFKQFWTAINGNFLLVLFSGIIISIKSLASLMTYLMDTHPIELWSFFWGLIVISSIVVLRQIKQWNVKVIFIGLLGVVIAFFVTSLSPSQTGDNMFMVFISGFLGISAMILPGISGAFILLILGKYKMIIGALSDLDFVIIGVFILGAIVGILTLVRAIAWLLNKYHDLAVAVLAGFMMGSLNKIWPWKEVLEYRVNSHGEQVPFLDRNIFPNEFYQITGQDPLIIQAVLFMAIGFFIVVVLEKIALAINTQKS
jgi:putative membrane protein